MLTTTINELPLREIIKGMRGRFVHSGSMTFAFWEIDEWFVLPEHSHHHEQVTQMIEGEFELTVAGKTQLLTTGLIATIPSNALHSGKALGNCKILDVFYPIREDYVL